MGDVLNFDENAIVARDFPTADSAPQPLPFTKEGNGANRFVLESPQSPIEERKALSGSSSFSCNSPLADGDSCAPAALQRSSSLPAKVEATKQNHGLDTTLLVRHIEALVAAEAKEVGDNRGNTVFASRQVTRLVHRCWPNWKGQVVWFENEATLPAALPVHVLFHLLGYLPVLQVLHLSTVCAGFAMPQPALMDAQTLPQAAIKAEVTVSGQSPRTLLSKEDPKHLWLRAAASTPMERCLVVRKRSALGICSSEYSLYMQDGTRGNEILLLVAKKCSSS